MFASCHKWLSTDFGVFLICRVGELPHKFPFAFLCINSPLFLGLIGSLVGVCINAVHALKIGPFSFSILRVVPTLFWSLRRDTCIVRVLYLFALLCVCFTRFSLYFEYIPIVCNRCWEKKRRSKRPQQSALFCSFVTVLYFFSFSWLEDLRCFLLGGAWEVRELNFTFSSYRSLPATYELCFIYHTEFFRSVSDGFGTSCTLKSSVTEVRKGVAFLVGNYEFY